jgi:uncharacterized lipoprotein YmbA
MMRPFLSIAVLALLSSACADSPQARFYTLGAAMPQEHARPVAPVNIAIDAVTVPELVDRPQIVVRVDATQVKIDEFARWAEPLKSQIARVLAADLAQSVPGALVSGHSVWAEDAPVYRVSVDVQSFESARGDAAAIAVLWTVHPPNGGAAVSGRTVAHEQVGGQGYDELVDAHSRALATVGTAIAGAIRATPRR